MVPKQSEYQRQYYLKKKPKLQLYKKQWMKKWRADYMKKLGEKCASCGEPYNPHARISNLQIDHKINIRSKTLSPSIYGQIQTLIKQGVDPNEQFMLLCKDCHPIVTYARKNPMKAKSTFDLISKIGILK